MAFPPTRFEYINTLGIVASPTDPDHDSCPLSASTAGMNLRPKRNMYYTRVRPAELTGTSIWGASLGRTRPTRTGAFDILKKQAVQNDKEAAVPALVGEIADWHAQERRANNDYDGVTLYDDDDDPIYLSIEAMSAANSTGFLQQLGPYSPPNEFALICNERALRSSIVLAQANLHPNDGGPRLLAHHGPVALELAVPKDFSHSVITIRIMLEHQQHCLKIALPLKEDLHLAAPVAGYSPVAVTPQPVVKLTDGIPHIIVSITLDKKNETFHITLVTDGQFHRLAIEFE